MKWEVVKRKVADEVYTGIKYQRHDFGAQVAAMMDAIAERRTVQESADDLADRCHKIIMAWDVRCADRLRSLFPDNFPPSLRRGNLLADSDFDGWHITVAK